MDKEINNRSRIDFLKKLSRGLVSIFSLGIIGAKLPKLQPTFRNKFKPLLLDEVNKEVGKISIVEKEFIKPEPPPEL